MNFVVLHFEVVQRWGPRVLECKGLALRALRDLVEVGLGERKSLVVSRSSCDQRTVHSAGLCREHAPH